MAKRKNFTTRIKRGDLVLTSGVGALIRTQSGVFGLVGSLADWESTMPVKPDPATIASEREDFLRRLEIRDPELEDACKVPRFIEPPSEPDDFDWLHVTPWHVPIFRFPLTEVCSNWQCQRVTMSSPGDPGRVFCGYCSTTGKKGRRFSAVQSPVFMVCTKGHLDEVPFRAVLPRAGCSHANIKISFGNNPRFPNIKCVDCGANERFDGEYDCTGRRPWISKVSDEECSEKMHLVERTGVNTYFPSTKSSIHIPADSNIDERVIDWLNRLDLRFFSLANEKNVETLCEDAALAGFPLGRDALLEHVYEVERRNKRCESTEEWNFEAARANEFDVLAGHTTFPALGRSRLLQFRVRSLDEYSHSLIGHDKLITAVTSVDVLTETRALDGFSRYQPDSPNQRDGFRLLWGFDRPKNSWLPAYRLHGEGIFFVLNTALITPRPNDGANHDKGLRTPLSPEATFAHSFAHLFMKELAKSCGYQLPSIRDRVYDLADGRVGFLTYTAEGDIVGTLGGLVRLAEPGLLEILLDGVIAASRWCGQDPVCIEKTHSASRRVGAACHQCLILPETCCERFNSDLDRRGLRSNLP